MFPRAAELRAPSAQHPSLQPTGRHRRHTLSSWGENQRCCQAKLGKLTNCHGVPLRVAFVLEARDEELPSAPGELKEDVSARLVPLF